jgi:hypothetical protein
MVEGKQVLIQAAFVPQGAASRRQVAPLLRQAQDGEPCRTICQIPRNAGLLL